MSTYVNLGSRQLTGLPDNTGNNSGNWTVVFSPDILSSSVPLYEVCHIVVNGAAGAMFSVFIDGRQWDTNQNGFANSWDPAVPMPLRTGETLYFYWSDSVTDGTPPLVTVWLRYDQDIRANLQQLLGMSGY